MTKLDSIIDFENFVNSLENRFLRLLENHCPKAIRENTINLDGFWEFEKNKNSFVTQRTEKIRVPFSPESEKSGLACNIRPDDTLYYRTLFNNPLKQKKDRFLLKFGAVDQHCEIFLNGLPVGEHTGGYLPFGFDVTDYLLPGKNELMVVARDYTEHAPHARGKQRLQKGGPVGSIFYTPTSGIWQSVWGEVVPARHIKNFEVRGDYLARTLDLYIETGSPGTATFILSHGGDIVLNREVPTDEPVQLKFKDPLPWSPDAPEIYDIVIRFGDDSLRSYTAFRTLERRTDKRGIPRIFLNGQPFFSNGLLDQGYWPESLLTPPSGRALLRDVALTKYLGFNSLRKHVKIEDPRFYALCDYLGLAVWQDMPNGGGPYNMLFQAVFPNLFRGLARKVDDGNYKRFKREDAAGRAQYYADLEGMVRHLGHHPSILVWVPFNEGWGQFDARIATRKLKAWDPTRLVCETSGWFDQGGGDFHSVHNYFFKLKVKPEAGRIFALTEYGGFAYPVPDHLPSEKEFGYRHYKTAEALTSAFEKLFLRDVVGKLEQGLSAAIYTQLSDIEGEINGMITYDRAVLKFDAARIRRLNACLYSAFRDLTRD